MFRASPHTPVLIFSRVLEEGTARLALQRGAQIGDELLKSIAQRLIACVRSSDTVSRQGGDEFLVLLSEVGRTDIAARSAQKILTAVSAPHRIEKHEVHVTVSIGISVYPQDGGDAETLLKNADTACFAPRARGAAGFSSTTLS